MRLGYLAALLRRRLMMINTRITATAMAAILTINVVSTMALPSVSDFEIDYLNVFEMVIIAGPSVTTNSDGKMKNTSGKMIFTVNFAAASSSC